MIEVWYKRNETKINQLCPTRKPFGLEKFGSDFRNKSVTANIAFGILTEVIFFGVMSILSVVFEYYLIWYAALIGSLIISNLIHFRDFIKFKQYTPGILTTIIFLIPMVWIFYQSTIILDYGILEIIIATLLVNVLMMVIVFQVLHRLMNVTKKLFRES